VFTLTVSPPPAGQAPDGDAGGGGGGCSGSGYAGMIAAVLALLPPFRPGARGAPKTRRRGSAPGAFVRGLVLILAPALVLCAARPLSAAERGAAPGGAPRSAEDAREGVAEEALAEARELLRSGRAGEAYRAYFSLLRADPGNDEVNLGLARAALAAEHPHQAIMAYERLLNRYPGDRMLCREIAQAYAAAGDAQTARLYLERDESLTEDSLGIFLGRLVKHYGRFQARGNLRFGAFYDSNANQGPDSDRLSLGGVSFNIPNAEKIPSGGLYAGGQYDAAWRAARSGPLWWVGDAAFYARYAASGALRDSERNYSQWYRAAGGFRWLSEKNMSDFRLKAEIFDYNFFQTVYALGGEYVFVHRVNPRFHLISRVTAEHREYVRSESYSGLYASFGQYARWYFGRDEHEFLFGGRLLTAKTDFDPYAYTGWELTASLRLKVRDGLELLPGVSYVRENYDGPGTVLETEDRRDERLRLSLGFVSRINERWSLEGAYHFTNNLSNSALFDYDRHMVSVGLLCTF
jgi:hypothetical protein